MANEAMTQQFGEVIRSLRIEKGFSQEAFADLCGLHRTYIGAIERGEKNITLVTAEKLASALELKLSDLMIHLEQSDIRRPTDPSGAEQHGKT